jgi:YD repeat-containing protein
MAERVNREKELLRTALIALEDAHLHIDKFQDEDARLSVIEQTKELLAQPEKEPVAWEKEKKSYLDEIDRLGVESNRDDEEIDRLTQLLTATDQKPLAWMYDWEDKLKEERMQDRITKIKSMTESPEAFNVRPLYTSPPKREPLSTKQAEDLWETSNFKSAVPYYIFDEICVAVEQHHGIGVDDETM